MLHALLDVLATDARFNRVYAAWQRRAIEPVTQWARTHPSIPAAVVASEIAGRLYQDDHLVADLDRLVRDDFQLASYPWLSALLQHQCRARDLGRVLRVQEFRISLDDLDPAADVDDVVKAFAVAKAAWRPATGPRQGRRARSDHDIDRDVSWFYRRRIQEPADSISTLTREYASAAHRHTESHSVVKNGINRIAKVLDDVVPVSHLARLTPHISRIAVCLMPPTK